METLEQLKAQRDYLIYMLAVWIDAVNSNGTSWDDWDSCYKHAKYGELPVEGLRELIDEAVKEIKEDSE